MPSLELIASFFHVQILLFLTFGFGALVTALVMLLHPNPVRSALFLVLNLFCVAVLYLLLNAYFLAAVQVVVYAGAIMVLFLFVIMLLNLGTPDRTVDRLKVQQPLAAVAGIVLAAAIAVTLVRTMPLPVLNEAGNAPVVENSDRTKARTRLSRMPAEGETGATEVIPVAENMANDPAYPSAAEQGTVAGIGKTLYNPERPYLFAFEVTSILLLIATIGSVVLAQRRTAEEKSLDAEGIA